MLTGIGLYGLLAYTVARRTNEIGIRMALGATTGTVGGVVLRDVLGMVCAGCGAGASMVLSSRPLAAGSAPMIAAALVASYLPVRRAVRVDPMVALRHE